MFDASIYHSYDIRGVVGEDFDSEEAYYIGKAYAQVVEVATVVVGRDMRESGIDISERLIAGLMDAGVNVIDIGMSTTPMLYFAVRHLQVDGGLMVTASHNPAKYNGIKMTRAEAVPIGGETGLFEIRDLVEKREGKTGDTVGQMRVEDVREAYLAAQTEGISAEGLKLVVDAGNGMAGLLLKDYFERIGGEVVSLYWEPDGTFPNHEADPLKEENLEDVKAAVLKEGADLGVAFDGDADRVFFVTETGETVPGDITTTLIAQEKLVEHPGATILYDLRSSRVVKEVVEAAGGVVAMSKVGHSNIKAQMREAQAVFAGELSGHFYFAPWYVDSGLMALGRMIKLLQTKQQKLSELVAPLKKYPKTPEINFAVKDKAGVLALLKEKYADAEMLELDGVSIIYPDWWANVRASNTEPLLRLNMEADTVELLAEKQAEITALIEG